MNVFNESVYSSRLQQKLIWPVRTQLASHGVRRLLVSLCGFSSCRSSPQLVARRSALGPAGRPLPAPITRRFRQPPPPTCGTYARTRRTHHSRVTGASRCQKLVAADRLTDAQLAAGLPGTLGGGRGGGSVGVLSWRQKEMSLHELGVSVTFSVRRSP